MFFSGQVALRPEGGRTDGGIGEQTRQVMDNIGAMLADVGLNYGDIVKSTIFMTDIGDYPEINRVYAGLLRRRASGPLRNPGCGLPGGFGVEIEVVAAGIAPPPGDT